MTWEQRIEKVQAHIAVGRTPMGEIKMAARPFILMPLLCGPRVKPLRGPRDLKDWRLELLVRPAALPTPAWRRKMRETFGAPVCRVVWNTYNPTNPLPVSVDGWWWHAGNYYAAQLAGDCSRMIDGEAPKPLGLGEYLGRRLSIYLEGHVANPGKWIPS